MASNNLYHNKGGLLVLLECWMGMQTCISLIEKPWVVRLAVIGLEYVACFRAPNVNHAKACVAVRRIDTTWEVSTEDLM